MSKYAAMPLEDYVSACDTIRFRIGGGSIKSGKLSENIDDVYHRGEANGHSDGYLSGFGDGKQQGRTEGLEEGKAIGYTEGKTDGITEGIEQGRKAYYNEHWSAVLPIGRKAFNYAFAYFNDKLFNPPNDIVPIDSAQYMFFQVDITPEHFAKVVERIKIDTSKLTHCVGTFSSMGGIVELPFDISLESATNTSDLFAWNDRLVTIKKIIVSETTPISTWFNGCPSLKNLTIEGTIGQNGFNVQWSTKLSKASWVSIMTTASTTASITITGSLVSVNKAFETSPGANDGSTSPEWLALKAARPTVSVSLV